jgi:hypothetical protein
MCDWKKPFTPVVVKCSVCVPNVDKALKALLFYQHLHSVTSKG